MFCHSGMLAAGNDNLKNRLNAQAPRRTYYIPEENNDRQNDFRGKGSGTRPAWL